jgi:hypothetical protein
MARLLTTNWQSHLTSAKKAPIEQDTDPIHFATRKDISGSIRKVNINKPLGEPI